MKELIKLTFCHSVYCLNIILEIPELTKRFVTEPSPNLLLFTIKTSIFKSLLILQDSVRNHHVYNVGGLLHDAQWHHRIFESPFWLWCTWSDVSVRCSQHQVRANKWDKIPFPAFVKLYHLKASFWLRLWHWQYCNVMPFL